MRLKVLFEVPFVKFYTGISYSVAASGLDILAWAVVAGEIELTSTVNAFVTDIDPNIADLGYVC